MKLNIILKGLKFPDMSRPETLQKKYVGKISRRALHFMKILLNMDPDDRPTSHMCLLSPYFEGLTMPNAAATAQVSLSTPSSGLC